MESLTVTSGQTELSRWLAPTGIVERVRNGEKHRFQDPVAIGRLIERMVDGEEGRA
jgi:hypothetical protein